MIVPVAALEGKYEIIRRLTSGGMGQIYLVRHRHLGELRVIKRMRTEVAEDEQLRHRFIVEAQRMSQLRHPHIAQIYDFATDDEGHAYLVMEYIDGVTLEAMVGLDPPAPLALVVEVACHALGALALLHRK